MSEFTTENDKPAIYEISPKNKVIFFGAAGGFCLLILAVFLSDINWNAGVALSVLLFSLVLWTFEPIPFGMTSILTIVLLVVLNAVSINVVLQGFSSPAVFLIIAGIMMAQGVNNTKLMERLAFYLVARLGGSPGGLFFGIFLLMQFQAFFIPATSVRVTLMLPIILMIIKYVNAERSSNFNKLMLVGTAYAGNISGIGVLTAGIANILTVEILFLYHNESISYFQWFLYVLPLWVLMTLTIPLLLLWLFPPEKLNYSFLKKEMTEKYHELGRMNIKEKKCISVLLFAVFLWVTEPFHGYHPVVPALIAVILMTTPVIGFVSWREVVKINFDLVLLVGSSLSLGIALIQTDSIQLVTDVLLTDWFIQLAEIPWLVILIVIVMTQIYHMMVPNINTAVVTFIPFLIALSYQLGYDPVLIAFVSSITTLFGFILVVQTLPNVIVHGTGLVSQKDFVTPGIYATMISIILTLLVAFTWWNILNFTP